MSGPNGNLSLEERSKLAPGTAVVWQTERGPERNAVVSHANGSGSLVTMEDGGAADYNAFLRLASWTPGKGQQSPAKAPETPAPANTGGEAPEPARALRKGFGKGNTPANKGKALVSADRWLECVRSVRARMDAREPRKDAIAAVAKEFPDLCLSQASYGWWQCRFIKEGKLARRPKTMPKRSPRTGLDDGPQNSLLVGPRSVAAGKPKPEAETQPPAGGCQWCAAHREEAAFRLANEKAAGAERDAALRRVAELEAAAIANPTPGWQELPSEAAEPFAALAACLVRIAALAPATQGRIVRAMAEIVGVGK